MGRPDGARWGEQLKKLFCVISLVVATTCLADLEPRGASRVALWLPGDQGKLSMLHGRGLEFTGHTSSELRARGHDVVWKRVRLEIDSRGVRHEFYRQHVEADGHAVELWGSEIGVHYDSNNHARAILGRQFHDFTITGRRDVAPDEVGGRALAAVGRQPNFTNRAPKIRSNEWDVLRLVKRGEGFRYAWFTILPDDDDVDHHVVFDAETTELLAVAPTHVTSNCAPTPSIAATATVVPVRPDIANRTNARANVATDRPSGFLREAYSSLSPTVRVYQQTIDPLFMCAASVGK